MCLFRKFVNLGEKHGIFVSHEQIIVIVSVRAEIECWVIRTEKNLALKK